jgi:hypothetical protein
MAAVIVNNVVSSSSQITYDYLESEELFGYTIEASYTIDLSDTNFQEGDTVLLQGREAIQEAYRRQNIVARIAGDEFVNGRITALSFGEGSLVGSETADITIAESRKLDSYASTTFAKYIPNPELIGSFEENYNFSRSGADYSYSRTISLQYKQEAGDQFLHNAKVFLTNYYFANRPSYGYQEDGISENAKINKNYYGSLSEEYDLLGLSVSLTEDFNSSFIDDAKDVSKQETQTLSIDENGYLNKTFQFELTALRLDSQNVLSNAIKDIIDEVKAANYAEFGSPFSIQKGIAKDGSRSSLTLEFSTDPKKSQDNIIDYNGRSTKVSLFTEYTLTMTYSSLGENNRERFANSKAAWVAHQPLNTTKIIRLFHPLRAIFEKSRNTNFQKTEGQITETIVFTTDPAYATTDDGVLKFEIQTSKTRKINRIDRLLDLRDLEGKVVTSELQTVGAASVTASALASPTLGIFKAKDFLESKTSELNARVGEDIIHITSDVSSLNLGDGTASRVINYIFI